LFPYLFHPFWGESWNHKAPESIWNPQSVLIMSILMNLDCTSPSIMFVFLVPLELVLWINLCRIRFADNVIGIARVLLMLFLWSVWKWLLKFARKAWQRHERLLLLFFSAYFRNRLLV
jgi:hypothetical protein